MSSDSNDTELRFYKEATAKVTRHTRKLLSTLEHLSSGAHDALTCPDHYFFEAFKDVVGMDLHDSIDLLEQQFTSTIMQLRTLNAVTIVRNLEEAANIAPNDSEWRQAAIDSDMVTAVKALRAFAGPSVLGVKKVTAAKVLPAIAGPSVLGVKDAVLVVEYHRATGRV